MGVIADRLGARLAEMRERHDREHAAMQRDLRQLHADLDQLTRLNDQLLEELDD